MAEKKCKVIVTYMVSTPEVGLYSANAIYCVALDQVRVFGGSQPNQVNIYDENGELLASYSGPQVQVVITRE